MSKQSAILLVAIVVPALSLAAIFSTHFNGEASDRTVIDWGASFTIASVGSDTVLTECARAACVAAQVAEWDHQKAEHEAQLAAQAEAERQAQLTPQFDPAVYQCPYQALTDAVTGAFIKCVSPEQSSRDIQNRYEAMSPEEQAAERERRMSGLPPSR
jgi:hypothetical protein